MERRVDDEERADSGEPDDERRDQQDVEGAPFWCGKATARERQHDRRERRAPGGQRRHGVQRAGSDSEQDGRDDPHAA